MLLLFSRFHSLLNSLEQSAVPFMLEKKNVHHAFIIKILIRHRFDFAHFVVINNQVFICIDDTDPLIPAAGEVYYDGIDNDCDTLIDDDDDGVLKLAVVEKD